MTKRNNTKIYIILIVGAVLAMVGFMSIWLYTYRNIIDGNYHEPAIQRAILRILKMRSIQMLGIIISVVLIAKASLSFQTITNNRILTPSILGFDAIFIITQTLIIFFLGTGSLLVANKILNFGLSTFIMIFTVFIMFILVMRKNKNNIILLLLLGMVMSSLAGSISNFIQVFMDPQDFQSVVAMTNVNIHNINESLVLYLVPVTVIISVLFYREHKTYDVMSLGEEAAINLGVNFRKKSNYSLVLITVSIAIATALVGPMSFLGLIVVNVAKELVKNNKHKSIYFVSSLLSIIFVLGGQVLLEISGLKTPVTVIVSLCGGLYMIYLLFKENRA